MKHLEEDPFNNYLAENDRGSIVNGKVKEVEAKQAIIFAEQVEAVLKSSEISVDHVEDAEMF